jgi:hypothetical protein
MSDSTPPAKSGKSPAGWCLLAVLAAGGSGALLHWKFQQPEIIKVEQIRTQASGEAAQAYFTTALSKLDQQRPDEAVASLLKVLECQPNHLSAQALLLDTLRNTTWHLPIAQWTLPFPARQIAFGANPDSFYTWIEDPASAPPLGTMLRWNLSDLSIQAVLPAHGDQETEAFSLSPDERFLVLHQRQGDHPRTSLIHPESMRVISELSPAQVPHGSITCFAWSADSALLAYPAATQEGGSIWRIIDSASGETVRESDPIPPGRYWLSAVFSGNRLRAISSDGFLLELPLQPAQPTRYGENSANFQQAFLSKDGKQLIASVPDETEQLEFHQWDIRENAEKGSLELSKTSGASGTWQFAESFRDAFPWSGESSGFWRGLTQNQRNATFPQPLQIQGSIAHLTDGDSSRPQQHAPLIANDDISALATRQNFLAVADRTGGVRILECLPRLETPFNTAESSDSNPPPDEDLNHWYAELDPLLTGIVRLSPLAKNQKLAACTAGELVVFNRDGNIWKRENSAPVRGGIFLHELSQERIAVLTADRLLIFQQKDLSKLAEFPLGFDVDQNTPVFWTSEPNHDWLAAQIGPHLRAWSLKDQTALLHRDALHEGSAWTFEQRNGIIGLAAPGLKDHWLPMAKDSGLTMPEFESLKALASVLSNPLDNAPKKAAAIQPADLSALLATDQVSSLKAAFLQSHPKTSAKDTLLPLWRRLAQDLPEEKMIDLARWASQLGRNHPWYQDFLRSQICKQDARLYSLLLDRPSENTDASFDPQSLSEWQQLAGDSEELVRLKQQAWSYLRSDLRHMAPLLTTTALAAAYPDIDFEKVAKLDPAALDALAKALTASHPDDPLLQRIREVQQRESIRQTLEAHLHQQQQAYETTADTPHLFALAEAMMWLGKLNDAKTLLSEHLASDARLDSAQCYFLISSRIPQAALAPSITELKSERIWQTWLQTTSKPEELLPKVEAILNATHGTGPLAISALTKSLEYSSLPAIRKCLDQAKDLPRPLRDYCTARCLWAENQKSSFYALWPEEIPNLRAKARNSNWLGWDTILAGKDYDQFFTDLQDDLKTIQVNEQQTPEQLKLTSQVLQNADTVLHFGAKRVRNAQLEAALILSRKPELTSIALQLSERAKAAGADPIACLRAEARCLATSGNAHEAYKRWLLVMDAEFDGKVIAEDYLDAAQSIFQDGQDIAGMELLFRGQRANPTDGKFALRAGWMALITHHAEQAYGIFTRVELEAYPSADKETVLALTCAAAELGGRPDLADKHFLQLIHTNQQWQREDNLNNLTWPDDVKGAIIGVSKRF